MTRKVKDEFTPPNLPSSKAIELFRRQIDKIDDLLRKSSKDPTVQEFRNFNINLITHAFGSPSENLSSYYSAEHPGTMYAGMSDHEWEEIHQTGLHHIKALFAGFIDQLQLFGGREGVQNDNKQPVKVLSKKVFIVHGHDGQVKSDLALILTRLGLDPIILHEQANEGLTLIEKLEKHADVGYAFVLLTPDDSGGSKKSDARLPRARQNVVFEFGLFVGKLQRSRVCCLYTGNIELPSDLHGLVYVQFNSSVHEIQMDIIRELRAAGYHINI